MSVKRLGVAIYTILNKEITRFLRIWIQTLLPSAITTILYFIIFGKLIGSQIAPIKGLTYIQYLVPGLTMMAIMNNAYSNTSSSFFGAKFSRSIEEMLVSSMPTYVILIGYTLGGALRGMVVGAIVLVIACFFTHVSIQHPIIVILIALLSAILFSLTGFINGVLAKKFDDVSFIPTFILTPLIYLGGIFYPLDALPPFWQHLSVLNPIFDIVDTFKYGMLGVSDLHIGVGFGLAGLFFVSMLIFVLYLLKKGVGLKS